MKPCYYGTLIEDVEEKIEYCGSMKITSTIARELFFYALDQISNVNALTF